MQTNTHLPKDHFSKICRKIRLLFNKNACEILEIIQILNHQGRSSPQNQRKSIFWNLRSNLNPSYDITNQNTNWSSQAGTLHSMCAYKKPTREIKHKLIAPWEISREQYLLWSNRLVINSKSYKLTTMFSRLLSTNFPSFCFECNNKHVITYMHLHECIIISSKKAFNKDWANINNGM